MKKCMMAFQFTMVLTAMFFLHASPQIANTISPADKVYGLSKFWQEVNYNFVYLDKLHRRSWDSAYKALIPQVQATGNDYDYYRLLEKFCALLHDGHTEVIAPDIKGLSFMFNTFGEYLLVLQRVDDKIIVKRTWQKDAELFPLGSEVVEVNGLPAEKFIQDSIAPYIASSTEYVKKDIASSALLKGAPGSTFRVKLKKPDGAYVSYTLTHARTRDSLFYPKLGAYLDEQKREAFEYKNLPGGIAYVALNTFGSNSRADSLFESIVPSLEKSKGIIVDLRFNGGGDDGVAFNILRHFIRDTVMVGSASVTRSFDPYLQATGKYVEVSDTAGNSTKQRAWLLYNGYAVYNQPGTWRSKIDKGVTRLQARVAILTSHNTESAAEDFLVAADNQKHIVRIGEQSNGSTGMPYSFDLPGGGYARICIKKDMYPDGREFVGIGIPPHVRVTPTVKDYLENRDVVLEAAIKYLKGKQGTVDEKAP